LSDRCAGVVLQENRQTTGRYVGVVICTTLKASVRRFR